jgi:hypothetical protein
MSVALGRSILELRSDAKARLSRGDVAGARENLAAALAQTVARPDEHLGAAYDLRDLFLSQGDGRAALTLEWFTGGERAQRQLVAHVPPIDRARTLVAWAEAAATPDRARALHAAAADEYEAAGLAAQAAISRERAQDFERARALWSRLADVLGSSGDDYAAGLARFNLARTARRTGDVAAARAAIVAAVHRLEAAADRYEALGQRERAFDCYEVLVAVGRESGELEHVLEGYVNSVRILREDHLRGYALETYEEAVAAAEGHGERAAAATLAREMAAYARKEGLPSVAAFATLAEARLWRELAEVSLARGAAPELAENAWLAAILALGEVGRFAEVGAAYRALAALPLDEGRASHYARASKRYDGARDLPVDASPLPAHLRHELGFPDVWHVDLVEWEQRGSASQACADVILDRAAYSESVRRRATLARLAALEAERLAGPEAGVDAARGTAACVALADQLANVELYSMLSPLEHLFGRPEREVKVAVVRALSRFLYKRSIVTLRAALEGADGEVALEAARALEELRFPHALEPLARIRRESRSPLAREAALRALARNETPEAAEAVLEVIEHGSAAEREMAVEALRRGRGSRIVELAQAALARTEGPARDALRAILAARGARTP